ncbi:hypothetical protein Tco_0997985 [Tanacetum coccineum]
MSMMGELKFFLGVQIHQSPHVIFINQAKYAQEILKKHGMTSCDSIGTLMATKPLDTDLSGTLVDKRIMRTMVGLLMYLTASRPDIVHATCYCARYQARPTKKHFKEVKQIFRCKITDEVSRTVKALLVAYNFLEGDKHILSSIKEAGDTLKMSHQKVRSNVSLYACYAQVLWMLTQPH